MSPRVTVLLIGVDSGVGRDTASTDTMIVASLDPVAGTVSMVSVPRDLVDAPLPKGGTFDAKINGLVSWVRWHPDQFPGYNGHGQAVLAYSLGKMLGVHIDYYAQVDLGGFVQAVNAVDGVDVNVDHAICDARYDEYGFNGYAIGAGRHHMNGNAALAYARIRKSVGESDFTRAARQQQVVVALKDRVVQGGFLDDPIGLLNAIGTTVQTNIPPAVVRELAPLAGRIGSKDIFKTVIDHPLVRSGFDARGSIQLPDFDKITALGAALFSTVGTRPPDRYVSKAPSAAARGPAQAVPSCSAPAKPRPTPKPTTKPIPSATPLPTLPTPEPTPIPTDSPPPDPSASSGP
jgi:LCP family protein required for cell wall assembly